MIGILLATYNGGRYINQLLASIRSQSHTDFRLYVRDDGSTDDTVDIVTRASRQDDRIRIVDDGRGNQRVVQNFARLMEHALADGCLATFFSDQDDVWHSDKVETGVRELKRMEAQHGTTAPILVHSDLEVVDSELKPLHPSFIQFSGITNNLEQPLQTLLVQNFVTGCTMLANRPLLEAALPIPKEAVMHDWWLALCAASLGEISFLDQPTIKYRQHEDNQVGATGFTYWQAIKKRLTGNVSSAERWELFHQTVDQVVALRCHLNSRAEQDSPRREIVDRYVDAFGPTCSRLSRVSKLQQLGVPALPLLRKALWTRRAFFCDSRHHAIAPLGLTAEKTTTCRPQ